MRTAVDSAHSHHMARLESMEDGVKQMLLSAEQHKVPYNAVVLPDHNNAEVKESLDKGGVRGLAKWFSAETDEDIAKLKRGKGASSAGFLSKAHDYVERKFVHDTHRLHLLCGCGPCDEHPSGFHFLHDFGTPHPGFPLKRAKPCVPTTLAPPSPRASLAHLRLRRWLTMMSPYSVNVAPHRSLPRFFPFFVCVFSFMRPSPGVGAPIPRSPPLFADSS